MYIVTVSKLQPMLKLENCLTSNRAQNENEQLKESAAGFLKLADETSESKMLLEKAENEIVVQKERITALEKERDTLKTSLHDAEQNYSETSAAFEAENNSLKEEITRLEAEDKSEVLKVLMFHHHNILLFELTSMLFDVPGKK